MEKPQVQLRKLWLNINGADRMCVCDPDESLAAVLRRLGLTGTKIGCGTGVCGACSVILNGKLIRSCRKKIKTIEQYSEVITIEGIGTPRDLHPLQEAWIICGGVQCGFCTPGFIVSSYALLMQNPSPTRDEVRDWFTKNRNICRCTGYKPLIDAVMLAAAVMRGETTIEEHRFKNPGDGEYYGKAVPRPAALAKVCGTCDYGDDIALKMPAETLHAAVVQPRQAFHANILGIDTSEAEAMPGVVKVMTAKDIEGTNSLPNNMGAWGQGVNDLPWPVLCDKKIYYYGSIVALVLADTRAHAKAAAAKVKVDLEKLPEYKTYSEAAAPDAMQIHDGAPNVEVSLPLAKGDYQNVPQLIDEAPFSVSGSFQSSREPHLTIEGDTVQAYWDEDGMMTIGCKSQTVNMSAAVVADAVGLEPSKVRIVMNPTGASFGWSMFSGSYAMAAAAVMATGRPVELFMSWEEFQHYHGKRAPVCSNVRAAADKDGNMTAWEFEYGMDTGPFGGEMQWALPRINQLTSWGYHVPNLLGITHMAATNHAFGITYRGYGSPQAFLTSESITDMLARKAGIDPFEFRVRNLAGENDTTPCAFPYRENSYKQLFEKARPIYEEAKARSRAEDTPEKRRGVGVSLACYVCTAGPDDEAYTRLELKPGGYIEVYNTWEDVGQGGDVGNVMHVLEILKPLGLTPDKVRIRTCDTKYCPPSGMAAGSRSHMMNGQAIIDAGTQMLAAMRKEDGSYRTYEEMTAEGLPMAFKGYYSNVPLKLTPYDAKKGTGDWIPTYMYGLAVAEVEVDTATGKVKTLSYTTVSDVGVVGNILAVDGQAYGGSSHCVGLALSEDYSDVKKHANMLGAGVPTANDVPDGDDFRMIYVENPRANTPWGSSGCSEMYQSGGYVSILNAICDACGVRVYNIPARPEFIKKSLQEIEEKGKQADPAKNFISGKDILAEAEELMA